MNETTDLQVLSEMADVKVKQSTVNDLDGAANIAFAKLPLWIKYTCLVAVKIALTMSAELERRR